MKTIVLLVSVILFCNTAIADNGSIAYAYPVNNISIDGDFSDWPADTYKASLQYDLQNNKLRPSNDFAAEFQAGYNTAEKALYIALTITDDMHRVTEDDEVAWNEWDTVLVYLDTTHTTRGSGPQLYSASGLNRSLLGTDSYWDHQSSTASWDNAEVSIVRQNDKTLYEWRLALPDSIDLNQSIGFDLLISDRDDEENEAESFYIWGRNSGKSQAAGRLGDLVLVGNKSTLGMLKGHAAWNERDQGLSDSGPNQIRITSTVNPKLWIQSQLNESGEFSVELPAGNYLISSPRQWLGDIWKDVKMIDQQHTVGATVTADQATTTPAFIVQTIELPDVLQPQGALFSYQVGENAEFDRVVKQYMDYYHVPGASIALIKDGKLAYHKVYGMKNFYAGQPVTNDTLFEAASITKIVFAFAVNRLAERGIIDMDKPLFEYLPNEDIAHDERYKKITARYVLSHQTGFPNWRWQNDDGQLDIKFYPGIKYGYSGEGFEYLGRVVSHITGKPLEQILMEEVQQPMGFTGDTFFSDSEALRKVASNGHFGYQTGVVSIPAEPGMAHSMYTEAKTFSNFMTNLIARKGLSADSYSKMLEPQIEVPLDDDDLIQWPNRYGLGFHMMNSPYGRVFGHGGNNGDFTCIFDIYDDHDMGFIVFTNSETGTAFFQALRKYLIIGSQPEAENKNL